MTYCTNIDPAEKAGIVRDVPEKDNIFEFTSNSYVSVLREQMLLNNGAPKQLSLEIHKRITEILKARVGDQITKNLQTVSDQVVFSLARHTSHSGPKYNKESIDWLSEAARRSVKRSDFFGGLYYGKEALARPTTDTVSKCVLLTLCMDAQRTLTSGITERQKFAYELNELLRMNEQEISNELRATALIQLALYETDDFQAGVTSLNRCIAHTDEILKLEGSTKTNRLEAYHHKARALVRLGSNNSDTLNSALTLFDSAIQWGEDTSNSNVATQGILAQLYNSRAEAKAEHPDPVVQLGALSDFEVSFAIKESLNDKLGQAMSLGGMARYYIYGPGEKDLSQNSERVFNWLSKNLQISTAIGNRDGRIMNPSLTGRVYLKIGQIQKAIASYKESLRMAQFYDNYKGQVIALIGLLYCYEVERNADDQDSIFAKLSDKVSHQMESAKLDINWLIDDFGKDLKNNPIWVNELRVIFST